MKKIWWPWRKFVPNITQLVEKEGVKVMEKTRMVDMRVFTLCHTYIFIFLLLSMIWRFTKEGIFLLESNNFPPAPPQNLRKGLPLFLLCILSSSVVLTSTVLVFLNPTPIFKNCCLFKLTRSRIAKVQFSDSKPLGLGGLRHYLKICTFLKIKVFHFVSVMPAFSMHWHQTYFP